MLKKKEKKVKEDTKKVFQIEFNPTYNTLADVVDQINAYLRGEK